MFLKKIISNLEETHIAGLIQLKKNRPRNAPSTPRPHAAAAATRHWLQLQKAE
jgi:hypothetical protein